MRPRDRGEIEPLLVVQVSFDSQLECSQSCERPATDSPHS